MSVPDGDENGRFPYTGRRFYWKGAVKYMLAAGKIQDQNLIAGLRATKHVSPSAVADAFKTIKDLWSHVVYEVKSWEYKIPEQVLADDIKRGQKGAFYLASACGAVPNISSGRRSSPLMRAMQEVL